MNDDDLTTDLGRELHGRSEAMQGSSLALADVRQTARSIRRRRTATAIGGAAAAVALIIPTAAIVSHQGHRTSPLPPATQSVTPRPSPTATDGQEPLTGVLDVSDLPTGPAPALDYLQDGTLHHPDGSTFPVGTQYTPAQFVELADGSIVWRTVDRSAHGYVEIRDPDGNYHDPVRIDSELSVNSAHSIVGWLTPSGQVMIWEGWASEPRALGDPVHGDDLRIGPLTGSGEAAPGQTGPSCDQSNCTVIVNVHDGAGPGQPWEVSESGSQPLRDGGYLDVRDVSDAGLTIGLTKATDSTTCSKLLGGGEFQGFATCKNQLATFSPDGRLIQAWPGYFDGIGPGGIAMFDLEGNRLFERSATEQVQSYYAGETWEDDTHLLVPTYQDGMWALVRIASDGSMEYAVAPAKGAYDVNPFVLATGGALP
jgi:hypothetical protein